MNTAALRLAFLEYFKSHGHSIMPSASLIPNDDPSLLFTNAGMVPFKEVFLGKRQLPATRVATVQRCLRAGGKHNDLDQVGYTSRHHTFFEMLGNFSFGDYFKLEALRLAWLFLTERLQIPAEKLWITVFEDDDETAALWLNEIGVDPARLSRCGQEDNFWSMGETGPCGPCSEIFYDHGANLPGDPPGTGGIEGERYVEIWNLVFMQYNRDAQGALHSLPMPCVDTGMGLERMAAVMQGVTHNYDTDVFQHLIAKVFALNPAIDTRIESNIIAARVIADHIRAAVLLVAEGIYPGNVGRAYVLRRIVRRALRYANKLTLPTPFLADLVPVVFSVMPHLAQDVSADSHQIAHVLTTEEKQFSLTLAQGLQAFQRELTGFSSPIIPGELVFRLYDTYGFPRELTEDLAKEQGLSIDHAGFARAMALQKEKSRGADAFTECEQLTLPEHILPSVFIGYEQLSVQAKVVALYRDHQAVDQLSAGEWGVVVLNQTSFYAEAGGQVGDQGTIETTSACFSVEDTQQRDGVYLHLGRLAEGKLSVGDSVSTAAHPRRSAICQHHSATHLLHAALRAILGPDVQQKGSLVTADRLRFDFSYDQPIDRTTQQAIEHLVNEKIQQNLPVTVEQMSLAAAKASGVTALFTDKYSDNTLRVLRMGGFSAELCGGTHVKQTGEIGLFKLMAESSVSAGVRRIEAVVGLPAIAALQQETLVQEAVLQQFKVASLADLPHWLSQYQAQSAQLLKVTDAYLTLKIAALAQQAVDVQGLKLITATIENVSPKALRETVDALRATSAYAVVVLATIHKEKVALVAGVGTACRDKVNAAKLLSEVAKRLGGKAGGRPDMAQGGGENIAALPDALASVAGWLAQ